MDNISPEEILRRKELSGGVVYDDPIQEESNPQDAAVLSTPSGSVKSTEAEKEPAAILTETPKNVYESEQPANSFGKANQSHPHSILDGRTFLSRYYHLKVCSILTEQNWQ